MAYECILAASNKLASEKCHLAALNELRDGKEGVIGSSPIEGFLKAPA